MGFLWFLASLVQFLLLYSLFSFSVTYCFPFIQPTLCHEDESHALLQFKQGFVINKFASDNPLSYPKVASWNASTDCCSWDGIECNDNTGHVIGIDLSSSQLYGSMDANSTLFHLVHLQKLDLADNDFNHSQIPSRIGRLSQLRYLNLSLTKFYGEVPQEFSRFSKLMSLDLCSYAEPYSPFRINLLWFKISALRSFIQNSTGLEILRLSYVTISSSVPDVLTNLSSLQKLSLYNCELYGEFQAGIFHLPNLRLIDLRYNQDLTGKFPDFDSSPLISSLNLGHTNFYGTLPTSIGKLSSLDTLSIPSCKFFGFIPSSLGNLTLLTYINLGNNTFRGDLSAPLANLTKLSYLIVGSNEFTIETISWIGKRSSIIFLDLSSVNIGSKIPLTFANLTQLKVLSAANSNLSGEIPSWIMNLTNLAVLNLPANNLHGEIPDSIFRLENLEHLYLSLNTLQGKLELDVFLKLKKLTFLDLSFNKLSLLSGKSSSNVTGSPIYGLQLASCNLVEFPTFIRNLDDLGCLDLSDNNISSLPSWLWRKGSLFMLNVSQSSLTGEISPSICNLKSLMYLDLSFNNLSGNIPSCLGNFSQSLQILRLIGNKFSGIIPQTYIIRNSLQMIDFSINNLQGQLPRALVNCQMLEYLDVSQNNINDSFPYWLGALPELKVLALHNNEFHGPIWCPRRMTCTFSKLHIIDLSHNEFSGNLPSEMIQSWKSMKASNMSQLQYEQWFHFTDRKGYTWFFINMYSLSMFNKGRLMVYEKLQEFYNMIAIDISSNKISGEIPEVIANLKGLCLLNLSNNMLTGTIPFSIGKLSNLEALDLSLNNLSGNIPQQLVKLTFLSFLNVSFNNLSGPIPQNNQFSTFQDDSFEGNKGLCGNQLLKKCEDHAGPSFASPSASDGDQGSGSILEFDWKIVLIGYGGGLVAGVALGSTYSPQILAWLRRVFWNCVGNMKVDFTSLDYYCFEIMSFISVHFLSLVVFKFYAV